MAAHLAQRRVALKLLGIFAGMALLLASIGIYGVMAYTFSRRTNEIEIHMAMGAGRADILRMAVAEGMVLVAAGLGTGLAGALVLTRFLQTMLFDVRSADPLTFAAIALLLSGAGVSACLIPAFRASRVQPLEALRYK